MVSIDAGRSRARPREGLNWRRLAVRLLGLLALLAALFVGLALASYDRHDPSWNHAVVGPVTNLMALPGLPDLMAGPQMRDNFSLPDYDF